MTTIYWITSEQRISALEPVLVLLWTFAFFSHDSRTMLRILDRATESDGPLMEKESTEPDSDGNAEKPPGVERSS